MKPLLKSAGGKSRFLDLVEPIYARHSDKRWVDLFCGGISMPILINPDRVWINDKNPHLINFYLSIKSLGNDIEKIELINKSDYFYSVREAFNRSEFDDSLNAHRYYYLNRSCFNGLMRFNKKGEFNSPFGWYKYPAYIQDFSQYQDRFKNYKITNFDWSDCLGEISEDDFIYLDPPYVTDFTQYTPDGFSWDDQVKLATHFSERNNPVILHNQDKPEVFKLYSDLGYDIQYHWREDKINSHRPKNNKVSEIIATKNI